MLIAVYGTLRYGASANDKLRGCKRLGEDTIAGSIFHIGGFPGLKAEPDGRVVVDVYEVPKAIETEIVNRLDYYEGYFPAAPDQSLFIRKIGKTLDGNLDVSYYEYKYDIDDSNIIKTGDWMKQCSER